MEPRSEWGMRVVSVSGTILGEMFRTGFTGIDEIPNGARLVDVRRDQLGFRYDLYFEAPEWPELEEGSNIPQLKTVEETETIFRGEC